MSDGDDIEHDVDLDLAFEFLGCKTVEKDGVLSFSYVVPGSEHEERCIAALCRVLRRDSPPLSSAVRWRLASLFDPNSQFETRALTIGNRRRGGANEPTMIRAVEISRFMAEKIGMGNNREQALDAAEERFGVSRSTAERAWSEHGAVWIRQSKSGLH